MDLGLYSLDWDTAGDLGADRVLDLLLEWHEGVLGHAFVDALTREAPLPPDAAAALEELLRRADANAAAGLADPLLAVELDLGKEADLKTFREFALFSTAAVVFLRDDDQPEIELSDSGKSFEFFADAALLDALTTKAGIPHDAIARVD